MRDTDKPKFLEVLTGVHDFYGKELSTFAGTVWWQSCSGFDIEQVTKALSSHLMDPDRGQFMPKPADLVRVLQGTHADRALIAWGKVLEAMSRVGAYQSVIFDEGAIHATIEDMGGWVKLCRADCDSFLQKRFCDTYRAYAKRTDLAYPSHLAGEHEQVNAIHGHKTADPLLIGDPRKALEVRQRGGGEKATVTSIADAMPQMQRIDLKASA